ncbi:MAG TPA: hypothetical protein PK514_14040 [Spirochaetota bacterium]|nr:hypothetical protein [Spirochaetota bacterium]
MNISIYTIFFMIGCAGIVSGIKFRNKWITIPSLAAAVMSAIMIVATIIVR